MYYRHPGSSGDWGLQINMSTIWIPTMKEFGQQLESDSDSEVKIGFRLNMDVDFQLKSTNFQLKVAYFQLFKVFLVFFVIKIVIFFNTMSKLS